MQNKEGGNPKQESQDNDAMKWLEGFCRMRGWIGGLNCVILMHLNCSVRGGVEVFPRLPLIWIAK
ncbi:hypothetical protein [Thiolapillus sp.]|uniref:hypothetical protein n=1 Tax=Thiolapillus sp. TaxID=2017437 RepID=UPI003AF850C1